MSDYQNPLCATTEKMSMFRDEWTQWHADGMPGCDTLFIPHLPTLNLHSEIVTRGGCSGHPHPLDPKDRDRFYLTFCVTQCGLPVLMLAYSRFLTNIGPSAAYTVRASIQSWIDVKHHCPHWVIEMHLTRYNQTEMIDKLMAALSHVIRFNLPYFHPERLPCPSIPN